MTEDSQTNSGETPENPVSKLDELTVLKQRATMMGIPVPNNISAKTLRARIEEKMAGAEALASDTPETVEDKPSTATEKTAAQIRAEGIQRAQELVRVQVACLNPNKSTLQGEIFTLANEQVGTISKYVPFNTIWHVPACLLRMIERRRFTQHRTVKENGREVTRSHLVKEFSVQRLAPLTPEEYKQLGVYQRSIAESEVTSNAQDTGGLR